VTFPATLFFWEVASLFTNWDTYLVVIEDLTVEFKEVD
jgi:hypothetical protein